jgi:FkbM family methyltransferase
MVAIKSVLDQPHFVFRPSQALRRIGQKFGSPPRAGKYHQSTLPWGLRIRYRPDEHIGEFLYHHGLYDLCVSEVLYRLADPGEAALDVGANIGQMSSILAARCGPTGRVHAFEPHPEIHQELSTNAELWRVNPKAAPVEVHRLALSDTAGVGYLSMSSSFDDNRGTASLVAKAGARTFEVPLQRLDELLPQDATVGVMKLDVEGHELGVLKGSAKLLERGAVRDIVFEDYGDPPTPVMKLLQAFGYRIFSVESKFFGLDVTPTTEERVRTRDAPPNYLATLDPERALCRLARHGWAVFGVLGV